VYYIVIVSVDETECRVRKLLIIFSLAKMVMNVHVLTHVHEISVVSFVSRLPAMDSEARSIGDKLREGDSNSPARQHRHQKDDSPARQHRHENDTSDCSA